MELYYYSKMEEALEKILTRSFRHDPKITRRVKNIIARVRRKGDAALVAYARKFDRVKLSDEKLAVKPEYLKSCLEKVDGNLFGIIKQAHDNIKRFHEAQIQSSWLKKFSDGVQLGQKVTPLDRVGDLFKMY